MSQHERGEVREVSPPLTNGFFHPSRPLLRTFPWLAAYASYYVPGRLTSKTE